MAWWIKKPFFCLPGGPPSNEMAFLQLAIPALLKIKGDNPIFFPVAAARLAETVKGKKDWTDFVHARLEYRQNELWVYPALSKSSLKSMAAKEALIVIPEDRHNLSAGEIINIQLLVPLTEVPNSGLTNVGVTLTQSTNASLYQADMAE